MEYPPIIFGEDRTATDRYYDQLDDVSKEIYNILYDAYKDGSTTSTITLNYSSVWKDQKITITSDNKMVMPDTFHPQVLSWERDMLTPAFLALIYDHPELSWLSGATYYMSYKINGISYNPSELDEDNSMVKRYNSSIYYDLYQRTVGGCYKGRDGYDRVGSNGIDQ